MVSNREIGHPLKKKRPTRDCLIGGGVIYIIVVDGEILATHDCIIKTAVTPHTVLHNLKDTIYYVIAKGTALKKKKKNKGQPILGRRASYSSVHCRSRKYVQYCRENWNENDVYYIHFETHFHREGKRQPPPKVYYYVHVNSIVCWYIILYI